MSAKEQCENMDPGGCNHQPVFLRDTHFTQSHIQKKIFSCEGLLICHHMLAFHACSVAVHAPTRRDITRQCSTNHWPRREAINGGHPHSSYKQCLLNIVCIQRPGQGCLHSKAWRFHFGCLSHKWFQVDIETKMVHVEPFWMHYDLPI